MVQSGRGLISDGGSDAETSPWVGVSSLAVVQRGVPAVGPWPASGPGAWRRATLTAAALLAGAVMADLRLAVLAGTLIVVSACLTPCEPLRLVHVHSRGSWRPERVDGRRDGAGTAVPRQRVAGVPGPRHARGE